jgi:cytochrome c5
VLLVGLVAAVAWSAGAAAPQKASSPASGPARRAVYAEEFPDGEGKSLAELYCRVCHAAPLVTQQAKDSTGWEKTLVQMEKWGIHPTPAEHDTLRRYLLSHYGPRAR